MKKRVYFGTATAGGLGTAVLVTASDANTAFDEFLKKAQNAIGPAFIVNKFEFVEELSEDV